LPQGVRLAAEAAQEKKAAGITVLDLRAAGAFTDYFVVCTGFSTPQVQAICTEIEAQLHKNLGRSPEHREGHRSAEWALLDFRRLCRPRLQRAGPPLLRSRTPVAHGP